MSPRRYQAADGGEPFEVKSLPRHEWIPLEVGNHVTDEVVEATRFPLERLVTPVGSDASASEVGMYDVKHLGAISILADREAWPHFPSHEQRRPWGDGNCEAPFSVGITGDVRREELATVPGAGV